MLKKECIAIQQDQLESFFVYLTDVRAAAEGTVIAYKLDIDMYLEYLQSKSGITTGEFVINDRTMRGFVSFLRSRGNVDNTIKRRLDGLHAYWKFLHLEYGFNEPKSPKDCGIRLKNKRNPSVHIPRSEYKAFMEKIYDDLRKIK